MAYGGEPGQNGPRRRPGGDRGPVPAQWGYGQQDDTQVPGQPGPLGRDERGQRAGGGGLRQPPEWPYPPQQPPYRAPQPPFRPSSHGKSWLARHKALTGLLAFVALIIIIAAARSGGPSSPPGNSTTAGLTTTASPTATQTPSHQATQAAATARKTQSQKTEPASPATSPAPAPSAPAAPTTRAAAVPPPSSAAPTSAAPRSSAAPASCHPLTNAGNCYEPGEFCRASDHGVTGLAGDGETITCADNDGWRWEPA